MSSSRSRVWLDGLGDWSWPGRPGGAVDLAPPGWVPSRPPRLESAALALPASERAPAWRLGLAALLSAALAALSAAMLSGGPAALERIVGLAEHGAGSEVAQPGATAAAASRALPPPRLPALQLTRRGTRSGGSIERASFYSPSLRAGGSFFVYLPHGYASGKQRYPVLYLLHGRNGHANAFLEIGIVPRLDRLIASGAIPPMIVVMIQDRRGLNNWRDIGRRHSATYVVEVQELVDRMLRTIPARSARAIAGSSMGGFGAMNVALANPHRFAVVESWLGYFDNLRPALDADRPMIHRLGLRAFLYGAAEDPVAVPSEDPEFAAELRAAGAQAEGVIYSGGHSLGKVRAHLETGLTFAGRALRETRRQAASEARASSPRAGA
jgi:enterochelin esterase-like enzyme